MRIYAFITIPRFRRPMALWKSGELPDSCSIALRNACIEYSGPISPAGFSLVVPARRVPSRAKADRGFRLNRSRSDRMEYFFPGSGWDPAADEPLFINKEVTMNSNFRFLLAFAMAGCLAACDSAKEDQAQAEAADAQAEAAAPAADAAAANAKEAADNAGAAIASAASATATAAVDATSEAANKAAAAGHAASAEIKEEAAQTADAAQAAADAARAKMDDNANPKKDDSGKP